MRNPMATHMAWRCTRRMEALMGRANSPPITRGVCLLLYLICRCLLASVSYMSIGVCLLLYGVCLLLYLICRCLLASVSYMSIGVCLLLYGVCLLLYLICIQFVRWLASWRLRRCAARELLGCCLPASTVEARMQHPSNTLATPRAAWCLRGRSRAGLLARGVRLELY